MKKPDQAAPVSALSPLDSRYAQQLAAVTGLFDEFNLNLTRVKIEIAWLKYLAGLELQTVPRLQELNFDYLEELVTNFSHMDFQAIKQQEQITNHDIKAVEYYLRQRCTQVAELRPYQELIHLGCTSDDINNLSYALIFKQARAEILLPLTKALINQLITMAKTYAKTTMLSRTHGQIATPTTFGKEMGNFAYRLSQQREQLAKLAIWGKFNGTVGNFNALQTVFPTINWPITIQQFVAQFGLSWHPYTTQIEPHDWLAEYCDVLARFNTILLGFCRDLWGYISIGYLKQRVKAEEVGSSVMPHKVNPIDFENAEGNLGLANAWLTHFSAKLPISRWQRDLSDSTVLRNGGVAIGHTVLAYQSVLRGLAKLTVDQTLLEQELNQHWEVLAEPIQTAMRSEGLETAYEKLKALTRGQSVDQALIQAFINTSELSPTSKQRLLALTPQTYFGLAAELAEVLEFID